MQIGSLHRKLVAFDSNMEDCIVAEMKEAGVPLVDWLKREAEYDPTSGINDVLGYPTFDIPIDEFRDLLFGLPDISELPITHNAWRGGGEPDRFYVRCFYGELHQGTRFYIERSGYDYPRYKGYVYE